jgi:diacylglycerol kinase (ATP)
VADAEAVVLIGNPVSGRGRGAAALDAAAAEVRARGIDPQVLRTEGAGHAVELARGAVTRGAGLVLVSGGDGTVRDVVEGLGGSAVPLGILPGGTGNDLARALDLPRDIPAAVSAALSGEERALDVWLWNGTPFVNVAGVGLDAAVAGAVNRRFRRLRGTAAYVAALLATLPAFRPTSMSLRGPGLEWSGAAWLAALANGCCYGGGMRIAPDADPGDGLLDVIVIEDVSKPELLRQFPRIFSGGHVRHPRVRSLRGESVRIEAPEQEATIDGELIGRTPATITRAPAPVRVRVPPVP